MKGISVTALRVGDASSFENGTFAEIICVKADLQMRVPEYISFEHASALGVGVLTVGRAFYDKFGLPYSSTLDDGVADTASRPRRQILIYGGWAPCISNTRSCKHSFAPLVLKRIS